MTGLEIIKVLRLSCRDGLVATEELFSFSSKIYLLSFTSDDNINHSKDAYTNYANKYNKRDFSRAPSTSLLKSKTDISVAYPFFFGNYFFGDCLEIITVFVVMMVNIIVIPVF